MLIKIKYPNIVTLFKLFELLMHLRKVGQNKCSLLPRRQARPLT